MPPHALFICACTFGMLTLLKFVSDEEAEKYETSMAGVCIEPCFHLLNSNYAACPAGHHTRTATFTHLWKTSQHPPTSCPVPRTYQKYICFTVLECVVQHAGSIKSGMSSEPH